MSLTDHVVVAKMAIGVDVTVDVMKEEGLNAEPIHSHE